MTDPLLATIPALKAEAMKLAEEAYGATFGNGGLASSAYGPALLAAHLALLCDLTRPASRDAIARLVAGRARIKVWAVQRIIAGSTDLPPEWEHLRDRLADATEAEATATLALAVLGGEATHMPLAADHGAVARLEGYDAARAAGDRARFARCKLDLARALGLPVVDGGDLPEWAVLLDGVRGRSEGRAAGGG